jgi:hypothetical protein
MADVEYIGPFESWRVVVDGRQVPFLAAHPLDGGRVDPTLDDRFGLILDVATAERVLPFLVNAIAVAWGYTAHPSTEQDAPTARLPFPRLTGLQFGNPE